MIWEASPNWRPHCSECGSFVSFADIEAGLAIYSCIQPDTEFTHETFQGLCRKHYKVKGDTNG